VLPPLPPHRRSLPPPPQRLPLLQVMMPILTNEKVQQDQQHLSAIPMTPAAMHALAAGCHDGEQCSHYFNAAGAVEWLCEIPSYESGGSWRLLLQWNRTALWLTLVILWTDRFLPKSVLTSARQLQWSCILRRFRCQCCLRRCCCCAR